NRSVSPPNEVAGNTLHNRRGTRPSGIQRLEPVATKTKASSREAIIVLGMHRSGTSAVSGVLAKLGAQAPRSLMPPTQDNPRGYWESSELMKFHDRVLESAGHRW